MKPFTCCAGRRVRVYGGAVMWINTVKRVHVTAQGLSLENRAPQIDGVLGALLAKLEKDKPTLELGPDDRQQCENFAFGVFGRADKVDRAGRADRTTAMTFYAASIFFEVGGAVGGASAPLCRVTAAVSSQVHTLCQRYLTDDKALPGVVPAAAVVLCM